MREYRSLQKFCIQADILYVSKQVVSSITHHVIIAAIKIMHRVARAKIALQITRASRSLIYLLRNVD